MQRDYILRIIEQLGAALVEFRRKILQQEDVGETQEALASTASRAGLDLDMLKRFDAGTLVMLVSPGGDVDVTRCWLMAELLYLDGLDTDMSGRDGADSLIKSRALYDLLRPMGGVLVGMPEAAERIAEIDQHLDRPPGSFAASGRARRLRAGGRRLGGTPPLPARAT